MTVIRPNSITGINSITAQGSTVEFYDPDGDTITIQANVSGNVVSGILTATTVDATTVKVGTGVTISAGVITATSFSGDGSGLSGIDATSLKDSGGNVKVQANTSGAVVSGMITVGDAFIKAGAVGLGTTNTAGRDAGIGTAPGTVIYNAETGSVQVYKQINGWVAIDHTGDLPPGGIQATGGIISDYESGGNIYRSHTFTSSGTFDVTELPTDDTPAALEYVVIAGGGGGGTAGTGGAGGGGGAGGYRSSVQGESSGGGASAESTITAAVQSYTVTIGGGGAATKWVPSEPDGAADPGSPTSFDNITSVGGGGGAFDNYAGQPGGSGGGTNRRYTNVGGTGTANQGYDGGGGPALSGDNTACGGGGAGAVGGTATSQSQPGEPGGIGVESSINGTATYRAGGGGGGGNSPQSFDGGNGGNGGGGAGAQSGNGWRGQSGAANSGGGGGGNHRSSGQPYPNPENTGGYGGSGVVIVRYQIAANQTGTAKATGGEVSFYNGKTIHTFTNSGTFTAPASFNETVEYVVVAGGGAGSNSQGGGTAGGGGGAGGYRTGTQTVTGPSPIAITVGAGGVARNITTNVALPTGSPSIFASSTPITSTGGGHGALYALPLSVTPGGSGGGGSFGSGAGNGNDPPTSPPQGNPGGDGSQGTGQRGGGGGGAGAAGIHGDTSGNGGLGAQLPATFRNPFSTVGTPGPGGLYYLAGGGGGGSLNPSVTAGSGGAGGGAAGAIQATPGPSGSPATGGGGGGIGMPGGGSDTERGGNGGSGIVLLAYPT